MLLVVVAHPQNDYAAWAKDAVAQADLLLDPATQKGRELFLSLACAGCHTVQGTTAGGKVGPELTHIAKDPSHKIAGLFSPVNAENLHRWIKDPQKEKPGTPMPTLGLDDATIDDIVKWLLTLK
jgi:cytochrome c oxidase subunit 2